jgi:hypothetical protein
MYHMLAHRHRRGPARAISADPAGFFVLAPCRRWAYGFVLRKTGRIHALRHPLLQLRRNGRFLD